MPVRGRGRVLRTRTIHPPGRPDVYLHVEVVSKRGPRGGRTAAGPVHHKKKRAGGNLRVGRGVYIS